MTKTKKERDYEGIQDILDAIKKFQELNKKHQEENETDKPSDENPDPNPDPNPDTTPEDGEKQGLYQNLLKKREEALTAVGDKYHQIAKNIDKANVKLNRTLDGKYKSERFLKLWEGSTEPMTDLSDISQYFKSNPDDSFIKRLVDVNGQEFTTANDGAFAATRTNFMNSVIKASQENIQEPVKINDKEGIAKAATDLKSDVPTKLENNKVDINPIPTSNINQQEEDPNIVNEIQEQKETLDPNRKGFINDKPTTDIQDKLIDAGFEPEQLSELQQAYVEKYGARDDRLKKIFSIFGGAR